MSGKIYYARINFNSTVEPLMERLPEHAKIVADEISIMSGGKCIPIPPSANERFGVIAFFMQAEISAREIKRRIIDPAPRTSPIQIRDEILVIEIGSDFDFSRLDLQATWLRNHSGS